MRHVTGTSYTAANGTDYKYYYVKVIFVFFKLIGLGPLNLVRSVPPKNVMNKKLSKTSATIHFDYSFIGAVYNVFLMVCLIGINCKSIPLVYEIVYLFKSKLTTAIELVEAICGNLAVQIVWLSFCIKQTTAVGLMNRLTKIDRLIRDLSGDCDESNRSYFLLLFFGNVLMRIAVIVTNQMCFNSPILGWFNNIVPCMIVNWLMIQYVMVIKLIEAHFRRLNRCLLRNARSLIIRPFRSMIMESSAMDDYLPPKIIAFRRMHVSLYEITSDVADFYSLPIVMAIAFSCYSIVYNSYYAVLPVVVKIENNGPIMFVASVLWLSSMGIPIVVLSASVESIADQVFVIDPVGGV